MTRPIVKIHNVQTNEVIEREMNDTEFAQYQIDQVKFAADKSEAEAKVQAKAALLERLGLTQEEFNTLTA
jgi:hypothetical protein